MNRGRIRKKEKKDKNKYGSVEIIKEIYLLNTLRYSIPCIILKVEKYSSDTILFPHCSSSRPIYTTNARKFVDTSSPTAHTIPTSPFTLLKTQQIF